MGYLCMIQYDNKTGFEIAMEELANMGYYFMMQRSQQNHSIRSYIKHNDFLLLFEGEGRMLFGRTSVKDDPLPSYHYMALFTSDVRNKLIKNIEDEENNKSLQRALLQGTGRKTFLGKRRD